MSRTRRRVKMWPIASEAAGVLPRQIPEAMAKDKELGIRETEYTPDGRPKFRSPGHQKEYCEAHGLGDLDGGYSSPQFKRRTSG